MANRGPAADRGPNRPAAASLRGPWNRAPGMQSPRVPGLPILAAPRFPQTSLQGPPGCHSTCASFSMSDPVSISAYSKDNPFPARVIENRVLNGPGSAKETRHIVVSIAGSGLHYKAGGSLGVFPSNRTREVDAILAQMRAGGDEPVMLPKAAEPICLREALFSKLALSGQIGRASCRERV